ncbi:hypothetical protein RvY_06525 [Ramazzottius varieornatus]|uniref:Uncharacterized protein n=1 Tax=Ramazzottius varieornatus TaxID=947166 RepID=A0A1D1V7K6_RAMVA|nr:hypothetical protein RvY_06525 [Ramazzottius varieornatus]
MCKCHWRYYLRMSLFAVVYRTMQSSTDRQRAEDPTRVEYLKTHLNSFKGISALKMSDNYH